MVVSVIKHSDNEIMLYVYKINTKNHLTMYFLVCIILAMIGGYGGICEAITKQLQSNYKAITKQLQSNYKAN